MNRKKGESHKTKILNCVKALLDQNFNQLMDEDSSSEEEPDKNGQLNTVPKNRKPGLYLGDRTNIQKMLNSLEQLM